MFLNTPHFILLSVVRMERGIHIKQTNLMEFAHPKEKAHSHLDENITLYSNKNVTLKCILKLLLVKPIL